ncbi:MAG: hypothetical protein LBQ36_07785 [Synergistaceae bacterium]|nr:hypothetical protein [Synergistaceae bacterium]
MKLKIGFAAILTVSLFMPWGLAGEARADEEDVWNLVIEVTERFFEGTLCEGEWEAVGKVGYAGQDYGGYVVETVYSAPNMALWAHETYESKGSASPLDGRVMAYATTDFSGLLEGLAPGMSERQTDDFFAKPYKVDGDTRFYTEESGLFDVVISFRDGKSHLLQTYSPVSGIDTSDEADAALLPKFEGLFESLKDSRGLAAAPTPAPVPAQTQPAQPLGGAGLPAVSDAMDSYPLSASEKNILGIRHRAACSMYSGKRYKDAYEAFSSLADEYSFDYIDAYWAGMSAIGLGKNGDAKAWLDRALAINPNYQPAIDARRKIK